MLVKFYHNSTQMVREYFYNKTFIVVILFVFFVLRALKFILFLSSISVPFHILKPVSLIMTGYAIYFLLLRKKVFFIIAVLVEDFWILLNSIYFLYFDNYFHILNFLYHLGTNFSSVNEGISFLSAVNAVDWISKFLIILVDLPVVILLINTKIFYQVKEVLRLKIFFRVWVFFLVILFLSEVFFTFKGEGIINVVSKLTKEGISLKEEKKLVGRYGIIFLNYLDIVYLNDKNIENRVVRLGKEIKFEGRNNKKNVIVIQVESLDSSVVSTDYKSIPITPFLRQLTTNSVFFPIVVSYHFAGYTSDAEFTVINSLHPLKDIPSIRYWKNYDNSIAKVFKSNNYICYAFHNNRGTFFGRKDAYEKMGFAKFFDMNDMGLREKGWGGEDKDMFEYVKNVLKSLRNTNFFIYIVTMSSHGPFKIVENYYTNEIFSDIEDDITRRYFNSINYVDMVLSNFISFVLNEVPNTVVIVFGDHHSSVQDSKYYKRSVSYVNGKVIEIVPLFILDKQKSIITVPVSQIDISPTILYLAGVEGRIRTKGEILLPSTSSKTIFYLYENISKDEIIKGLNFITVDNLQKLSSHLYQQ